MEDNHMLPSINQNLENQAFKQLTAAKQERKKVEDDARLLANRIALLKLEEEKTLKKISTTKQKAYQIYQMKSINEEKQRIKLENKGKQEKLNYEKVQQIKKCNEVNLEQSKKMFTDRIQCHAELMKNIILKNKNIRQQRSQQEKEQLYIRSLIIKQQMELTRKKVSEFYEIKKLQNQCNLINQANQEEIKKQQKEQEIMNMEKIEIELIQQLQDIQTQQKKAYNELESALVMKATDFQSNFLNEKSMSNLDVSQQDKTQQKFKKMDIKNEINNLYTTQPQKKKQIPQDKRSVSGMDKIEKKQIQNKKQKQSDPKITDKKSGIKQQSSKKLEVHNPIVEPEIKPEPKVEQSNEVEPQLQAQDNSQQEIVEEPKTQQEPEQQENQQ